jgi:chromate transporter
MKLKEKLRGYWELFIVFFRIGLFTFGGGFAMLPLIEKEVVDVHGWAKQEEIVDIFALAQSVPGAIAVNTAVFIGLRLYGLPGAIAALLGVVTPSIVIILIIAQLFSQFQSNLYVSRAFSGVKGAVIGLIAAATLRAGRSAIVDRFGLVVAAGALALSVSGIIPVVWVILLGGLSGILYYRRRGEVG